MNIADLVEEIIRTPHPFAIFMSRTQLRSIGNELTDGRAALTPNFECKIMGLPVLTVKRMPPGVVVVAGSQYNPMKGGDRGVSR